MTGNGTAWVTDFAEKITKTWAAAERNQQDFVPGDRESNLGRLGIRFHTSSEPLCHS